MARSSTSVIPAACRDRIWSFFVTFRDRSSGCSASGLSLALVLMAAPFALLNQAPASPQEPFQAEQGHEDQEEPDQETRQAVTPPVRPELRFRPALRKGLCL